MSLSPKLSCPEPPSANLQALISPKVSRSRAPKLSLVGKIKSSEVRDGCAWAQGNFLQVPGDSVDLSDKRNKLKKRSVSIGTAGKSKSQCQDELTLSEELGLTVYQQKLLVQSWPQIYKTGSASTGAGIFTALCGMNGQAKELFQMSEGAAAFGNLDTKFDIRSEHGKLVLEALDLTLKTFLVTPSVNAIEYYKNFGASHRHLRRLGFNSKVWDDFGECLLNHVRKCNAVRKHKELARAWAALISFLVDKLKSGQSSYSYHCFRSCEELTRKWQSSSIDSNSSEPALSIRSRNNSVNSWKDCQTQF